MQPTLFPISQPNERDPKTRALSYVERLQSDNTRAAYTRAWKRFEAWCSKERRRPFPASYRTVLDFLSALADRATPLNTIRQYKAAIRRHHHDRGHTDPGRDPRVRVLWQGIVENAQPAAPPKLAILQRGIRDLIAGCDQALEAAGPLAPTQLHLADLRDRAIILLTFAGALRRGEVANLEVEQMVRHPRSYEIQVAPSELHRRVVTIKAATIAALCPVTALGAWLETAEITEGFVFRRIELDGQIGSQRLDPSAITHIVRRRCALAGVDYTALSPHSLRRGAIAQDAFDGADDQTIQERAGLSRPGFVLVKRLVTDMRTARRSQAPPPHVAQ